jgi:hypothetical protein
MADCHMLSADEEPRREFQYFNEDGVFIGKSEGTQPDEHLFRQAHYVFDSNNDTVKNRDLLIIMQRRLKNLRATLIKVPIQQMDQIMEINRQIRELEQNIAEQEQRDLKEAS